MREDLNSDSGTNYQPVNAPVTSFFSYYMNVSLIGPQAEGPFEQAIGQVPQLAINGFSGASGYYANPRAGTFAEGAIMRFFVEQRLADHQAFFKDLSTGLMCIADAANVIGNLYHNTDATSAIGLGSGTQMLDSQAGVDAVNFAFANPGATAPAGTQSWAYSGGTVANQNTGLTGPMSSDPTATPTRVFTGGEHGGTILYFSDGSTRTVRETADGIVVTTYDAKGNAISSNNNAESLNPDGTLQSQTQTQTAGDAKNGSSQTTTVTYNTDGSVTITTTTDAWYTDAQGKLVHPTGYPQTDVQTVQENPSGQGSHYVGPLQSLEQQYHSTGSQGLGS
jgi:hypothetical protein